MPIKRGKRWVGRVTNPSTRERKIVGTYATKREAKDAEDLFRNQNFGVLGDETCDSFAEKWIERYPRPKASTNRLYHSAALKFGEAHKGIRLTALDRLTARDWALKNPSNLRVARIMFNDAVRDGLCNTNPFNGLRLPRSEGRKHITALTEHELNALAACALRGEWGDFGKEVRAMILFAGYVGCRPGELYALQRADIEGDFVEISRAFDSTTRTVTTPKNGKGRVSIVPPPVTDALKDVTEKDSGLLFATPGGRRWSQSGFYKYWDRVRSLYGQPGLDLHELRHCAATMLLERGVSDWDVAIQLGHQDGGKLIRELYGHPSHVNARARLLAAYGVEAASGEQVTVLRDHRKAAGE